MDPYYPTATGATSAKAKATMTLHTALPDSGGLDKLLTLSNLVIVGGCLGVVYLTMQGKSKGKGWRLF